MTNNEPTGQHDLPRTYLKRFVIDPNNRKFRSMIYCYWENQYETKCETVSINSKKFKNDNFYTVNHPNEPFIFETFFKDEIEPLYNKIMIEIESEQNPSFECRNYLILWLFYNKYRNKAFREIIENLVNFQIETSYSMQYGKEKFKPLSEEAKSIAASKAKKLHLQFLFKEEMLLNFEKGIGTNHWIILKSKPNNQFLTNDDPGFSINIEMGNIDFNSLNSSYATNYKASNFFILSPKYCLLISPFWEGTPLDISILNQHIEFKITNNSYIDFINYCTKVTRTKYLISNNKIMIDKHTKINT